MLFKGVTRPVALYWGGRRPADLYLDEWVRAKLAEMPDLGHVPVVSDAPRTTEAAARARAPRGA